MTSILNGWKEVKFNGLCAFKGRYVVQCYGNMGWRTKRSPQNTTGNRLVGHTTALPIARTPNVGRQYSMISELDKKEGLGLISLLLRHLPGKKSTIKLSQDS
jgi:hypothetical protein